jgi:oxygen-independent coproporphyrinogen-3 oxidase
MSLYMLEVYPHLPLRQEIERYGWRQEPEERAAEMYGGAMVMLESAGYMQYEISNASRPGFESRHNLKYWTDGEWLGFGPGAHSTVSGVRWRNVSPTLDYIDRVDAGDSVRVERRSLSTDERLGDAMFMGLRLSQGVAVDVLSARYGVDIWARFLERLKPFLEAGILLRRGDRLALTRDGMLVANEVMSVFV